jgi:hypothetical protein
MTETVCTFNIHALTFHKDSKTLQQFCIVIDFAVDHEAGATEFYTLVACLRNETSVSLTPASESIQLELGVDLVWFESG